jgi:hypothetical protein
MAESHRRRAHRAGEQGRELPQTLRDAAEDDPGIIDAYDAGHAGRAWESYVNGEAPPEPPKQEPAPAPAPEPAPPPAPKAPAPATKPPKLVLGGARSETGAGLFLGAFAYALLLSLINYGTAGPGDWLRAKFLNKPTPAPGTGGATTGAAAPGAAKATLT